ncbi:MAG: PTS sugar transporter subunit IIB [Treponema sp.]|jgi:PTS system galactitol-specific IIB component|nr:PTS sugar transporter subunit IIB [Treponema sp.]
MKQIMLACGSGIVTSTAVKMKLTNILNERGYEGKYKITQFKVAEVVANSVNYDFCIATTYVSPDAKCPVIPGVSFLTGIGMEPVIEKIMEQMEK